MRTAAVICECNPLHNGHAYLFRELRCRARADYVLAIMSGNFVQRGEPAIYDKFTRAEMVLLAGADAVIELPPLFAMSSAREFATAAVRTAEATGVVDVLGFGAEGTKPDAAEGKTPIDHSASMPDFPSVSASVSPSVSPAASPSASLTESNDKLLSQLTKAASLLQFETEPEVQIRLRAALQNGLTYPAARSLALTAFLTEEHINAGLLAELASLLQHPNNILALEYLRALEAEKKDRRSARQIGALAIQRRGDNYHSEQPEDACFTSATALRGLLLQPRELLSEEARREQLARYCPEAALPVFAKAPNPLSPESISLLLNAAILAEKSAAKTVDTENAGGLFMRYADMSEALSNRLLRQQHTIGCFSQRVQQLKTRQYTQLRVQRALLHLALHITEAEVQAAKEAGYVQYLRLLGFRREAAPLLRNIKEAASLPLVTKPAAAKPLLAADSRFDELYYALRATSPSASAKSLRSEFSRSPVIIG